ncbi:L-threonylcarbamoyladenylate synthase [Desulforudis sp. DRI-14]|uniref:L-threonylcarbamoyladenylate synthase n=1 Tax=Desulforudis sp. DRI-14 TaxID=3459793 RepID=UPI003BBCD6C2
MTDFTAMLVETHYWRVDPINPDQDVITAAARILRQGGLVAFPTETVYGLGANALDSRAVKRIFIAKGRPADNPLIVHVSDLEQAAAITAGLPPLAVKLAKAFWPGPLTLVLPKADAVPGEVTAGLDTVAVRMPDHRVALALIRAAGLPVAAPSANVSGRPSPTTGEHVRQDLEGRVEVILDAGPAPHGLESTILDLTTDVPVVLRPGGVTREALTRAIGTDVAVAGRGETERPRAPGMKYRHYAPRGELYLVEGDRRGVPRRIAELAAELKSAGHRVAVLCSAETARLLPCDRVYVMGLRDDPARVGARLYQLLRRCDEDGVTAIVAEGVEPVGVGEAVMNRLRKAAGKVITVGDDR